MDLGSINAQIATAVAGAPAASSAAALTSEALAKEAAGKGFDFASSLDAALKAVSHSQAQSDELQRQFALQNPDVGLEDTVVAMSIFNNYGGAEELNKRGLAWMEQDLAPLSPGRQQRWPGR